MSELKAHVLQDIAAKSLDDAGKIDPASAWIAQRLRTSQPAERRDLVNGR